MFAIYMVVGCPVRRLAVGVRHTPFSTSFSDPNKSARSVLMRIVQGIFVHQHCDLKRV